MNNKVIYDAVSGVSEEYLSAADDTDAIRRSFQKERARRTKIMGTVCACAVLVLAAGWIGSQSWFGKTPALTPDNTVVTDRQVTGEPASGPTEAQPGIIPQETVSASESTEKSDSNTENPTEQQPTNDPERQEPTTQAPTDTPSDDTSVIWGEQGGVSSSSYAYVLWNGKQVGYELWEVLQKDTAGKTIAIVASPTVNLQFVYNGKTIARYEDEAYYERRGLPEKLQQLLKEGDVLKYGEALYTTGTPDGEIWARDFYESKIAYYGTELLSKYIVNGNFLADQVAADLALAQNATAAQDAYNEAVSAFYSQAVSAAASAFSAVGLQCSVTGSGKALLFFASAGRFAGLPAPGNAEWYFSLAQNNSGETVRE